MSSKLDQAYKTAVGLEDQEEYADAAEWFAVSGLSTILSNKDDSDRHVRIGIGLFIRAIACETLASNKRRARILALMIDPIIENQCQNSNTSVLCGLYSEWRGDICLFTGGESAEDYYKKAKKYYQNISHADRSYGSEEEFFYAKRGYELFANAHDYSLIDSYDYAFEDRVESKLELYGTIVRSGTV